MMQTGFGSSCRRMGEDSAVEESSVSSGRSDHIVARMVEVELNVNWVWMEQKYLQQLEIIIIVQRPCPCTFPLVKGRCECCALAQGKASFARTASIKSS